MDLFTSVLILLTQVLLSDNRDIPHIIFLLEDPKQEKEKVGAPAPGGKQLQFIEKVRIATINTGSQII